MVRYRRNRVQGGTYFFTVTLGKCRLYVRRGLLPEDWAGDVNENPSGYGERRE